MGLVSLIKIVNVGLDVALAVTGMYPEKKPVTEELTLLMGIHG